MEYINIEFLKKGLYFLKKPLFGENNEIDIENTTINKESNKKLEYYRTSEGFKEANDMYKQYFDKV